MRFGTTTKRADETLTELITTGKIPPLIAVGIDNGSDAIHQGDGNGNARAREFLPYPDPYDPDTLAPSGTGYPDFLESEVMSVIAAKYPVETGPRHTAIWAASYGGVHDSSFRKYGGLRADRTAMPRVSPVTES